MELISTSIYVILFIFLLVFIFSMAILSPYLEKKDIGGILLIAFIIGAVGGLFFISPIYEDFPEFISEVDAIVTGQDQYINIDISSQYGLNTSEIINKTRSTQGVDKVVPTKVSLVTGNFSSSYVQYMTTSIEDNINQSSNIENVTIDSENGIINATVKNSSDPQLVVDDIRELLIESYDITPSSTVIRLQAGVSPLDIDTVTEDLRNQSVPVSTVEGSIANNTKKAESQQLPIWMVSVICGLIGIATALLGIFADTIYNNWKRMGTKRNKRRINRNFSKTNKTKTKKEEEKETVFEEGTHSVEPNPQKDIVIDKKEKKSLIFKNSDKDFDELNKKSKNKESKERTLDDFKEE